MDKKSNLHNRQPDLDTQKEKLYAMALKAINNGVALSDDPELLEQSKLVDLLMNELYE